MIAGNILITGGGIGGLFAALALRKHGIESTVFEASPVLEAAGAGILMAPNALAQFARVDPALIDQLRACGCDLASLRNPKFGITDGHGRPLLAGFDAHQLQQRYGHGLIAIARSELHALLLRQLPAGALITGKRLATFSEHADDVTAHFADGSAAHGAILVAAEGLGSPARKQLFPHIAPRYSGQTSYRALVPFETHALDPLPAAELWGSQLRFGFTPVGRGQVYWFSTRPAVQGQRDDAPEHAIAHLLRLARDMHPNVAALLQATPPARLLRTDISDLPALPAWHCGRVVLLGDAAHATTPNLGQGGCQAIEDGWTLAAQLAAHASHLPAFAEYQRLRKPKAERVTQTSRQLGGLVHLPNAPLRMLRNTALRMLPASLGARQSSWIYTRVD